MKPEQPADCGYFTDSGRVRMALCCAIIVAMSALIMALFSAAHAGERSSQWRSVREVHLRNHQACEACGATKRVEVHHVPPVHEYPDRELDAENLITLCPRCHLVFGHLGDYQAWNPRVRKDAVRNLAEVKARPYNKKQAAAFEHQFLTAP